MGVGIWVCAGSCPSKAREPGGEVLLAIVVERVGGYYVHTVMRRLLGIAVARTDGPELT